VARCQNTWGNRRVTHFGHLAQPQTSLLVVFEVLFKKAALALSQGLTGSARCVASFKSAGGTALSQRKDAAKDLRQSFTLSGPKNVGIKSKVVRTQETMLLNRTRRSK
jgi:hypothetical protein